MVAPVCSKAALSIEANIVQSFPYFIHSFCVEGSGAAAGVLSPQQLLEGFKARAAFRRCCC